MFEIIREIGAITRSIQNDSNQRFKEDQLNNNLFIYIIRVVERPGMFMGELADSIQADRTTSFRTVKKLVDKGYLELKSDPTNLKIKRVYPTKQAKSYYPKLHAYEQNRSDQLVKNLSGKELDQLKRLMRKLNY